MAVPLVVTGKVATPTAFATAHLKALPQVTVTATDRNSTAQEYTGVALATLLEAVGVAADATALVFIGGDGYEVEVTLSDAR